MQGYGSLGSTADLKNKRGSEMNRGRSNSAPADDDNLPPATKPPAFIRAKSVEEQKSESVGFAQLVPAFRRQNSFEHSLRPVPILEESEPKDYYGGILRGMGFDEGEIAAALKEPGERGIEDYVAIIINVREGKSDHVTPGGDPDPPSKLAESGKPSSNVVENDFRNENREEKSPPLTLSLDEKADVDWKCRFCNGYVNSATTEVCIQCNRARALCEELNEEQVKEDKLNEQKKQKDLEQFSRLQLKQAEELKRLEQGPWPCRFCDHSNGFEILDCTNCGSMKYLTRVFYTDEEWILKLKVLEEDGKRQTDEDEKYNEEWEKKEKKVER